MAPSPRVHRDPVSGRFARRPVPDVDAESRFDPMGDSIEDIGNVSGAPSANTIDHPRHAPAADTLAGTGPSYGASRLRARRPGMVPAEDAAHETSSRQGAVLRAAARGSGPDAGDLDPVRYLTGCIDGSE
jgi:hypothetical protein